MDMLAAIYIFGLLPASMMPVVWLPAYREVRERERRAQARTLVLLSACVLSILMWPLSLGLCALLRSHWSRQSKSLRSLQHRAALAS